MKHYLADYLGPATETTSFPVQTATTLSPSCLSLKLWWIHVESEAHLIWLNIHAKGQGRQTRSGRETWKRSTLMFCLQDTFPQKVLFSLLLSRKSSAHLKPPEPDPHPHSLRQGDRDLFNQWKLFFFKVLIRDTLTVIIRAQSERNMSATCLLTNIS